MPARSKSARVVGTNKKLRFVKLRAWRTSMLERSPHRSFQRTRRRDYVRPLALPGYVHLTRQVNKVVWDNRKVLAAIAGIYLVLYVFLVGIGSQETYRSLITSLQDAGSSVSGGDVSKVGEAGTVFLSIATQGISETPSEAQQIYLVLLGLMVWLATIWLVRNRLAGHKVGLLDALYNSGAPIIPLFITSLILVAQCIPILLAYLAYNAALASGLLDGGVEAMLFWFGATFLSLLSLYWATSTVFSMVIVSLPGMKPLSALRNANSIMLGRRLKILLRWSWMIIVIGLCWAVILLPVILLDIWLSNTWDVFVTIPIVPVTLAILGALSLVWVSVYVYVLYRKVVDASAK